MKFTTILATTLVGLSLTACGGGSSPAASSAPDHDTVMQNAFLQTIWQDPYLAKVDNTVAIQGAKTICGEFTSGRTFEQVIAEGDSLGIPETSMARFIGAGVPAFCPQNESKYQSNPNN